MNAQTKEMRPQTRGKYLAISLDDASKLKLLQRFPPRHPNVKADHITISLDPETYLIERGLHRIGDSAMRIETVAYMSNDRVDCVLVRVEDNCVREVGGYYHVTMSTIDGASARESNDLIRDSFDKEQSVVMTIFQLRGTVNLLPTS